MLTRAASLFAVAVFSAASLAVAQGTMLPPDNAAEETNNFLRDLIRIDTQDPPGNESKVAQYIAGVLQREGIAYELLEPVPGRASIVARLKGTGAQRPVLL